MSSDNFTITILSKADDHITLRVRTDFSGGPNDLACTRSFALTALVHARRRWNDNKSPKRPLRRGIPFKEAKAQTQIEKESNKWPGNWYVDEEFFKASVDKYIVATKVLARYNQVRSNSFGKKDYAFLNQITDQRLPIGDEEDALCTRFHFIELDVQVADPRWLRGVEVGWIFGTTAFDVWYHDPQRPSIPRSRKVKPSGSAPEKKESAKQTPKAPDKKTAKSKGDAFAIGVRVNTSHFGDTHRAVIKDRRTAKLPAAVAKRYKTNEFAYLVTDDGVEFWENLGALKVVRKNDFYEAGRKRPEKFWSSVMGLPMVERAEWLAQVTGPGSEAVVDKLESPRYTMQARRIAGFLSALSLEQAARYIADAFPVAKRPKSFDANQPFEKFPRAFDAQEWQPQKGESKLKFKPSGIVSNLIGALAWRIGQLSATSNKGPAALISRAFLDIMKKLPEAKVWMPFFASKKKVAAAKWNFTDGLYGLPGPVAGPV